MHQANNLALIDHSVQSVATEQQSFAGPQHSRTNISTATVASPPMLRVSMLCPATKRASAVGEFARSQTLSDQRVIRRYSG